MSTMHAPSTQRSQQRLGCNDDYAAGVSPAVANEDAVHLDHTGSGVHFGVHPM
jgi:hypothetical protein